MVPYLFVKCGGCQLSVQLFDSTSITWNFEGVAVEKIIWYVATINLRHNYEQNQSYS